MLFIFNNQEYEFLGEYRRPVPPDYFLSDSGEVFQAQKDVWSSVRAIVRRVPEAYYFGCLKFVKSGESRPAHYGDFYLDRGCVAGWFGQLPSEGDCEILTLPGPSVLDTYS